MSEALSAFCDELVIALAPLVNAAQDPEQLQALLAELGWTPNSIPAPLQALADAGAGLIDLIGGDSDPGAAQGLAEMATLLNAINAIATSADGLFPSGIDVAAFKSTIGREMLDYLVVEHLLCNHQRIGGLLKLAGLIRLTETPAAGLRQVYLKRQVQWSELGLLFTNPTQGFSEVFDWDTAPRLFDLLADFTSVLESFGLQLDYFMPVDELLAFVNRDATDAPDETYGVDFSLSNALTAPAGIAAGVQMISRPATATRAAALSIFPYALLNGATDVDLADGFSVSLSGNADFSQGISLTFAPHRPPQFEAGFLEGGGITTPGEARLEFKIAPDADEPERIVLGAANETRFALKTLGISIGAHVLDPTRIEALAELTITGAHIVIKPAEGDADSFLNALLPAGGIDASLSFGVRYSSLGGFQFTGAGGLQISLPVHVQLGPVDFQQLAIGIQAVDQGLELDVGAAVAGTLGPLAVAIDGMGFKLVAHFPDPPQGNLGPIDLAFGFKPPNGVGLAIDAGIVKGGGYLYLDAPRGEYAGAMELIVADWLALTAVGLITTKMPDGSSGFSLLIIITADFGSGIQLGFGFTLLGVGGLLGLNRTMLFQPLMDGVRTGAIDEILFPTDVIANAPKIISDLKAIFPPKEGTFLVGPMAKLGWGSPPLITISLGVIIEIPPGDVAILGMLQLAIPEDDPVLILRVNFAGALEFSKQRLYFFASIFDSHILTITLDGEMGVLFAYGADSNLVLSVGGFHPQFNPPPLPFPTPNRVQIDIINESAARVRCGGYVAATTNTLQFGAFAEYFFGFSSISVSGHSSFDALIQRSPLHLIVSITTTFSVTVFGLGLFGLDVDLTVEGPAPWHIHGYGKLGFLFFSIPVPIDQTIGDAHDTSLPPIPVMPILAAEIGKQENWRAALPPGANILVTLRQMDATQAAMVLHPAGTLQVSQRAIPLDLTLDKVGAQKPTDANRFTLEVTSTGLAKVEDLEEPFAPAQFQNFDDAAKLSAPAYSPQHSGIELAVAGGAYASGTAITRRVRYDLTIIDVQYRRLVKRFFVFVSSLFVHFARGGSTSRNPFSAAKARQMQPFADKIVAGAETYLVANQSDNRAYAAAPTSFTSRAAAQDALNRTVKADPALAEQLHVLPRYEVAA